MSTLHSKPSFVLTCAVPRTGRTLHNFLKNLKSLGVNADEIDQILNVLAESKRRSTTDLPEALGFLQEISNLRLHVFQFRWIVKGNFVLIV